jgi:hypothetical protein
MFHFTQNNDSRVHISKVFSKAHIYKTTDLTSKDCTAAMLEMLKGEILKEYTERETGMYFHVFHIWDLTIPFNP